MVVKASRREKHPEEDKKNVQAEQEVLEIEEKEVIGEKVEKEEKKIKGGFDILSWIPKTRLGKLVKSKEIKNIGLILDSGEKIKEYGIVDALLPDLNFVFINIGQSKGKFGGGKRSIWRQTQKKTMEGNRPKFATLAALGNRNGYVGIGYGKAKETVPAREKAIRNSKLNLIKIRRGCGEWACGCGEAHSIPFKTEGKCGSVRVVLFPAPKGTGLCIEEECRKILELAGIKDVYSRTFGQTKSRLNRAYACFCALKNLMKTKSDDKSNKIVGLVEGEI
jgi:small subunit ribosomal protein S5